MKKLITLIMLFCVAIATAQTDSIYFLSPSHLQIKNGDNLEEAAPILSADKKRIYFTVTDKSVLSKSGQLNHEIWYADFINGGLGDPVKADKPLNIGLNSGVIGMSQTGKRLYLFGALNKFFEDQKTISYTDLVDGRWQKPKEIEIPGLNISGGFYGFYVHPSEKVILISQSTDGQEDLYISALNESTQTWMEPQPLNGMINSSNYEISPFLTEDMQYLYFSRGTADADADIFVSKRVGESLLDWSEPERLPAPINSRGFDAYFSIDDDSTITFSSNRDGTADIFVSAIRVQTIQESKPKEVFINAELMEPVMIKKPEPLKFQFNAQKTNYVFFDFNSARIPNQFKNVISSVAEVLQNDPDMIIEVAGHTDYIDNEEYNAGLSDKRALRVSEALIAMGIDKNRIFPIGYGESLPISNNESTKGRALNRRVEMVLMKKEVSPRE